MGGGACCYKQGAGSGFRSRGRSLLDFRGGFGDVTRASAPAQHTSRSTRCLREEEAAAPQTSDEHGAEPESCHPSTQQHRGRSAHLRVRHGALLSAGAQSSECHPLSFCIFRDSTSAEEKGSELTVTVPAGLS